MREQLNFREKDIQLARRAERREVCGQTDITRRGLTQEQMEELIKRIEHEKK